jgi:hypothetical protein
MRKCPKCAEEIQYEAVICKHCKSEVNAVVNKPEHMPGWLVVVVFLAIGYFIYWKANAPAEPSAETKAATYEIQEKEKLKNYIKNINSSVQVQRLSTIKNLTAQGVIYKVESKVSEKEISVYVNAKQWEAIPYDQKGIIARAILDYFMLELDGAVEEVKIYDHTNNLILVIYSYDSGYFTA